MKYIRQRKTVTLQVPDVFDGFEIAKKYRKRKNDQKLLADRLNWFVSLVVTLPLQQDVRKELETRGYMSLHFESFREIYKSDKVTDEVITILVKKEKLIQQDNSYRTQYYSKGYRLSAALRTGNTKSVHVMSEKMRTDIFRYWEKSHQERKRQAKSIKFLINFIEDPELKVDLVKAHHFVEHWSYQLTEKIKEHEGKLGSSLTTELVDRAYTKTFYTKELLRRINDTDTKRRYWKRDAKGLRLHSSFTGLKSPLRHFLTYKGSNLVSIDIMSSQPYLFCCLLYRDFWEKRRKSISITKIHPNLLQTISNNYIQRIIMSLPKSISDSFSISCVQEYLNIPWRMDYYQLLMENVKRDYANEPKVYNCYKTRPKTKFYNMLLFFEPRSVKFDYTRPFEKYFPVAFALMNAIRKIPGFVYGSEVKSAKAKHNNLPIILQRVESTLILDIIYKKIYTLYPDIFLLTIHDSIITTKQSLDLVYSVMEETLTELVGSVPGLKVEELLPENVLQNFDDFIEEEWTEMMYSLGQRKRAGREVSDESVLEMLSNFGSRASQPLILGTIPEVNGRKLLSTRFVSDYTPDDTEEV